MIKSGNITTLSRTYLTFFLTLCSEQVSHRLEEAPGLQGWRVCAQVKVGSLQNQNSSVTLFCLRSNLEKEWRDWRGGLRMNVCTLT